jgi:CheY-like chemotaxis protein
MASVGHSTTNPSTEIGVHTILLVDDENMFRIAIRDALELDGYRVLEASNGSDALEVLARWDGRIDLLLTDLRMPVMGGLELMRAVRERRPEIPVLLMSGLPLDGVAMEPSSAFLPKPVRYTALLDAIRSTIANAR